MTIMSEFFRFRVKLTHLKMGLKLKLPDVCVEWLMDDWETLDMAIDSCLSEFDIFIHFKRFNPPAAISRIHSKNIS